MERVLDRDLGFFFCGLWDLFSLPEVFFSCFVEEDLLMEDVFFLKDLSLEKLVESLLLDAEGGLRICLRRFSESCKAALRGDLVRIFEEGGSLDFLEDDLSTDLVKGSVILATFLYSNYLVFSNKKSFKNIVN